MLRSDMICLEMKNASVLTCVALAVAGVHIDGPTANGAGCATHVTNQDSPHPPKLAVHASAMQRTEAASFNKRLASAQVYSRLKIPIPKCTSLRTFFVHSKFDFLDQVHFGIGIFD